MTRELKQQLATCEVQALASQLHCCMLYGHATGCEPHVAYCMRLASAARCALCAAD
jgi:hypothetical protein